MVDDAEDKDESSKPVSAQGKFARFNLAQRPQRRAGGNLYFDDLRAELSRNKGQLTESPDIVDEAAESVSILPVEGEAPDLSLVELEDPRQPDASGVSTQSGVSTVQAAVAAVTSAEPESPVLEAVPAVGTDSSAGVGVRRRSTIKDASLPSPAAVDFEPFEKRWSLVLVESHLLALRVIFDNTVAVGKEEYFIEGPVLAAVAGVKRRQLTNMLLKLEGLGLIERDEWKEGKSTLGLRLKFVAHKTAG